MLFTSDNLKIEQQVIFRRYIMANIASSAVNGEEYLNVTAISANYTVTPQDQLVQVTTGTSVIVVTLPAPVAAGSFNASTMRPDQSTAGQTGNVGQMVRVEKVDTGNGTVTVSGTLNIGVGYSLASRWSQASFVSDGTRWNLVSVVS
jgi:hypothetical protein